MQRVRDTVDRFGSRQRGSAAIRTRAQNAVLFRKRMDHSGYGRNSAKVREPIRFGAIREKDGHTNKETGFRLLERPKRLPPPIARLDFSGRILGAASFRMPGWAGGFRSSCGSSRPGSGSRFHLPARIGPTPRLRTVSFQTGESARDRYYQGISKRLAIECLRRMVRS
jgi:hypothetical protein